MYNDNNNNNKNNKNNNNNNNNNNNIFKILYTQKEDITSPWPPSLNFYNSIVEM